MIAPAALIALACYAVEPAPFVGAEVLAALRGSPVAQAPIRADIQAAIEAAASLRRRRHGR